MARIREKTLKFPGLDNVYTFADEADLFNANVACAVGEYRIYNGDLYCCTTAHTGAWDASHFKAVKMGNEVSGLKTALSLKAPYINTKANGTNVAIITDGAKDAELTSAVVTLPYNENGYTGATLTQKTSNICGGIDLANKFKTAMSAATINETNKTVSFAASAAGSSGKAVLTGFEEGKQYTFIFHLKTTGASKSTNMRIYYKGGTYTAIEKPFAIANTEYDIVVVSDATKSVASLYALNLNGTTTIYYELSGVFEGAIGLDDFVDPENHTFVTDWTSDVSNFYGGTYDFVSGELIENYNSSGSAAYVPHTTTKHSIQTAKGKNTFSVETGTISIGYCADTKLYVDESIDEPKSVTATLFGYNAPDNADARFGIDSLFVEEIKDTVIAWMTEYSGDAKKIPFIVHTDQHGALTQNAKGIFDLIDYIANWNEISAIFNLGDTILDHWSNSTVTTNPLDYNAELEKALIALESIPLAKQINVIGNHDTWYTGNIETAVSGILPSLKYLNPYFKTNGLRTVRLPDNSGNMVVYDDNNKVRYLVVGDWDYADRATTNYQYYYINKAHWEWIIKELSTDCGYDIVIVSHIPLKMYGTGSYNPITSESIAGTAIYISYSDSNSADVFAARKAKTSGSITVGSDTVSYDFTNCTDNILCAISGHTHKDGVDRAGDLLTVSFDRFSAAIPVIHFGLIDRENERINVWKVSGGSTPTTSNWQAPFDAS